MLKVMVFIDGSWLYKNIRRISQVEDGSEQRFMIDFGKLPVVVANVAADRLNASSIDLVRTFYFASEPYNYDPRDEEAVQRQRDFNIMLRDRLQYETELYPIDLKGMRYYKKDRDKNQSSGPQEKCVDMALATTMLYYAAIPRAYDVAVIITGDLDYKPALQRVRQLGKRIAIAGVKGSFPPAFSATGDPERVRDVDVIWLDELRDSIALVQEAQKRRCESKNHVGDPFVLTTWVPRLGQQFFCPTCMRRYQDETKENIPPEAPPGTPLPAEGSMMLGKLTRILAHEGTQPHGYIRGMDGIDYMYWDSTLHPHQRWEDLRRLGCAEFEVAPPSKPDQRGAKPRAMYLRMVDDEECSHAHYEPSDSDDDDAATEDFL